MPFSWGQAGLVGLIGFSGVFAILFILALTLSVINSLVRRFTPRPTEEEKE